MKRLVFSCLFLLLLATTDCFAGDSENGHISGKWITKDIGPMSGAQVLLFNMAVGPPPASDKYLRVPDATATIDSEGKFSVPVAAGRYNLVMRRSAGKGTVGPPQDGDLQFYSRDKNGKARSFVVKAGSNTDIGTISEATLFKRQSAKYVAGMTAIEGTVTNAEGVPVEGVRVFAYVSPEMTGKPRYASAATGKDGRYLIALNNTGMYYLKVRSHYGGGKPDAGEFMGGYGEPTDPKIVIVKKGEISKGVDIKIARFPGRETLGLQKMPFKGLTSAVKNRSQTAH